MVSANETHDCGSVLSIPPLPFWEAFIALMNTAHGRQWPEFASALERFINVLGVRMTARDRAELLAALTSMIETSVMMDPYPPALEDGSR